jgi:hypothetical protein
LREKWVLRRNFVPKRKKVTAGWAKLHIEKLLKENAIEKT